MTFWVAGAVAVGSIGSAYLQKEGARKAARAQMSAADVAREETQKAYDISKGYYQPYYDTGTAASNRLAELMGIGGQAGAPGYGSLMRDFSMADYQQDPGYQFRLQEGLKQLQRNAAARGGMLSGATLAGTQKYAQGLASQEYGNAYQRFMEQQQNRYNMLSGQQRLGATTAGSLADLSSSYGANLANIALGKGQVEAQKTAGEYSGYGNMLQGATNFIGSAGAQGAFGGGTGGMGGKYLGNIDFSNVPKQNLPTITMPGRSSTYGG